MVLSRGSPNRRGVACLGGGSGSGIMKVGIRRGSPEGSLIVEILVGPQGEYSGVSALKRQESTRIGCTKEEEKSIHSRFPHLDLSQRTFSQSVR